MYLFIGFILGMSVTVAIGALILILGIRKIDKLNDELKELKHLDDENK